MIRLIGMLSVIFSSWTHFFVLFVVPVIILFVIIIGVAILEVRKETKRIRKRTLHLMDIINDLKRNR